MPYVPLTLNILVSSSHLTLICSLVIPRVLYRQDAWTRPTLVSNSSRGIFFCFHGFPFPFCSSRKIMFRTLSCGITVVYDQRVLPVLHDG